MSSCSKSRALTAPKRTTTLGPALQWELGATQWAAVRIQLLWIRTLVQTCSQVPGRRIDTKYSRQLLREIDEPCFHGTERGMREPELDESQ